MTIDRPPNPPRPRTTQNGMLYHLILQTANWASNGNLHASTHEKTARRKPILGHLPDEQPYLGVDSHPPNLGGVYSPIQQGPVHLDKVFHENFGMTRAPPHTYVLTLRNSKDPINKRPTKKVNDIRSSLAPIINSDQVANT